jgi:hypothetical protein
MLIGESQPVQCIVALRFKILLASTFNFLLQPGHSTSIVCPLNNLLTSINITSPLIPFDREVGKTFTNYDNIVRNLKPIEAFYFGVNFMNLGEAKKKALALMLEYSNDGTPVPEGENADYLAGMNLFAHDAQMEISNRVAIITSYSFSQTAKSESGYTKYQLPVNFKRLISLFINDVPVTGYQLMRNQVWVPKTYGGQLELFYEQIPAAITSATLDSYEFEIDPHTHHLIPYYLGGMALAEEKESVSSKLLNIYFAMMENLTDYKNQNPSSIISVDGW